MCTRIKETHGHGLSANGAGLVGIQIVGEKRFIFRLFGETFLRETESLAKTVWLSAWIQILKREECGGINRLKFPQHMMNFS